MLLGAILHIIIQELMGNNTIYLGKTTQTMRIIINGIIIL